jgi:hypothetical protein
MTNIKLGLLVIATCAFVSGCIRLPVYGESWAEQVQTESDACPDLDGVYQNAGEAFEKKGGEQVRKPEPSLAHLLNGGFGLLSHRADDRLGITTYGAAADDYQTIRLRLVKGKLHVTGSRVDGSSQSFVQPTHETCRNSTLLVETDYGYDLFSGSFVHGGYSLGRAHDGSLLAYGSAKGTVLVAFVHSNAFWVRFPPVAEGSP